MTPNDQEIRRIINRMVYLQTLRDGMSRARMGLNQLGALLDAGDAAALEKADAALATVMERIDRRADHNLVSLQKKFLGNADGHSQEEQSNE